MRKTILLSAGHGGIINGEYVTDGKRYYDFHKGRRIQLAEGAFNRLVVHGIAAQLHLNRIPVHIINPENEDISLMAKARRVNQMARKKSCVLLSVHHNAFKKDDVYGTEFFTSKGDTPADPIAEYIGKEFTRMFPGEKLRRSTINPKEYSKDYGYTILESTVCPAVLSEWAFMTNEYDREKIICGYSDQIDFFAEILARVSKGEMN